jgi:uncharacterized protein YhfF
MWRQYLALGAATGEHQSTISYWHFCDNEHDANECARLVVSGRKRATAPSRWSFESRAEALPRPGQLHVITNWEGQAQCVIRITAVQVLPLNEIGAEHARAEGEGDGSLAWWQRAHWAYYQRELAGTTYQPEPDMPIVFEWFECVYPVKPA